MIIVLNLFNKVIILSAVNSFLNCLERDMPICPIVIFHEDDMLYYYNTRYIFINVHISIVTSNLGSC